MLDRNAKPELKIAITDNSTSFTVSASGPGVAAEAGAELWFVIAEDRLVVDETRGENANRTLKHSGVVRVLKSAGDATKAGPIVLPIEPSWRKEHLHVIAFVQSKKDRRVLAVSTNRS